eukprot:417384-Pelagomonas_calceolata.AAC.4
MQNYGKRRLQPSSPREPDGPPTSGLGAGKTRNKTRGMKNAWVGPMYQADACAWNQHTQVRGRTCQDPPGEHGEQQDSSSSRSSSSRVRRAAA